jgi:hypothetical protein
VTPQPTHHPEVLAALAASLEGWLRLPGCRDNLSNGFAELLSKTSGVAIAPGQ